MSIWCSHEHIGTDPNDWTEMDGTPVPKVAERGIVLSRANGFSNHHPDLTGKYERPAAIGIAHIPEWCVPGHDETDDTYETVAAWLRLEVAATETLNFWVKDDDGNPTVDEEHAIVVLDEEAVRSLHADLSRWLERPKAHPIPTTPPEHQPSETEGAEA
jgi:hypothetical protein